VKESVTKPWKLAKLAVGGIKTSGAMAKDIPIDNQRPADFVFSGHVERKLTEIRQTNPRAKKTTPVA
jgi:hypothetical protein